MTPQERIEAARAYYRVQVSGRLELEERLAEAGETMKTVAGLFPAALWALLPDRIKKYFEKYRT